MQTKCISDPLLALRLTHLSQFSHHFSKNPLTSLWVSISSLSPLASEWFPVLQHVGFLCWQAWLVSLQRLDHFRARDQCWLLDLGVLDLWTIPWVTLDYDTSELIHYQGGLLACRSMRKGGQRQQTHSANNFMRSRAQDHLKFLESHPAYPQMMANCSNIVIIYSNAHYLYINVFWRC